MIAQFGIHVISLFVPVDLPPPPPPPPVVAVCDGHSALEAACGHQTAADAVIFDGGKGHVGTTGRAELTSEYGPETEAAYHYRLCTQLQEIKPWIDWDCVVPQS